MAQLCVSSLEEDTDEVTGLPEVTIPTSDHADIWNGVCLNFHTLMA